MKNIIIYDNVEETDTVEISLEKQRKNWASHEYNDVYRSRSKYTKTQMSNPKYSCSRN